MDTKHFGWPISSPIKVLNSKVFIEVRKGLTPCGFFNEKQCIKGAFKRLEKLLKHYNMQDTDISAEAFIFLSTAGIKLRDSTGLVRCSLPGLSYASSLLKQLLKQPLGKKSRMWLQPLYLHFLLRSMILTSMLHL